MESDSLNNPALEQPALPDRDQPLVRSEALDQIRQINPELAVSVVTRFLSDTPVTIEKMNVDLASQNFDGLKIAAHSLKSNAATVGADQLADCFSRIELGAVEGSDGLQEQLEQVEKLYRDVVVELEEHQGG